MKLLKLCPDGDILVLRKSDHVPRIYESYVRSNFRGVNLNLWCREEVMSKIISLRFPIHLAPMLFVNQTLDIEYAEKHKELMLELGEARCKAYNKMINYAVMDFEFEAHDKLATHERYMILAYFAGRFEMITLDMIHHPDSPMNGFLDFESFRLRLERRILVSIGVTVCGTALWWLVFVFGLWIMK